MCVCVCADVLCALLYVLLCLCVLLSVLLVLLSFSALLCATIIYKRFTQSQNNFKAGMLSKPGEVMTSYMIYLILLLGCFSESATTDRRVFMGELNVHKSSKAVTTQDFGPAEGELRFLVYLIPINL